MKKLILSAALLSGIFAFSQEHQSADTVQTKKIESVNLTKKVFQKKADRLIYDVAATPSAKGSTAFDLMKETPTITNTDDKEFKILGKSAVVVYINGKKSNMNADAINALLKGTPAENISKIEVISVPGSEYDVPGNTGIINIVMKKKTADGYNGTLRMENEKGYYDNPSSSLSVNFRKNKIGGNVSGGYAEERNFQRLRLENGDAQSKTISEGSVDEPDQNLYANAALDFDINDKNYLGFNLNTSFNTTKGEFSTFENRTFLNNVLKKTSLMESAGNDNSKNISTELHYERNQDEKGSKLKLNVAYLYYKKTQEDFNRNFLLPSKTLFYGYNQNAPQIINNYALQADEIKKFNDEATLSFGGNFSFTKTDNDTYFESGNGSIFAKDSDQSNHFVYNETIGAVYANYEKNLGKKVSAKAGLRYEITDTKGDILGKTDEFYHFKKSYGNILPFLNINYNINENNNLSYNFSSRIRRPSFWELNPVRHNTTTTNYIQNNPFMMPSKIYSQELMYMYRNAYFLTLGHMYEKDAATQIPLQKINAEKEMELRYIRTNYGDKQDFSATLGMQKSFFKNIWVANYTATINHSIYKGSVNTDPLTHEIFDPYIVDRKSTFFIFSANNQVAFDMKKTWWLGADYFIVTPQNMELGKLSTIQQLNFSVKKTWENWTFKAAVDDVLNTNHRYEILNQNSNGYFSNVYQTQYTRNFTLSATYNFGNQKIKGARREDSANKDIKSRTGGK